MKLWGSTWICKGLKTTTSPVHVDIYLRTRLNNSSKKSQSTSVVKLGSLWVLGTLMTGLGKLKVLAYFWGYLKPGPSLFWTLPPADWKDLKSCIPWNHLELSKPSGFTIPPNNKPFGDQAQNCAACKMRMCLAKFIQNLKHKLIFTLYVSYLCSRNFQWLGGSSGGARWLETRSQHEASHDWKTGGARKIHESVEYVAGGIGIAKRLYVNGSEKNLWQARARRPLNMYLLEGAF